MTVRNGLVDRVAGGHLPARVYSEPSARAEATLVLAHGAGAPQAHPFMVQAGSALAGRGLAVVTFDFPYTAARRKLPDKAPVLEAAYLDVIAWVRRQDDLPGPLVIGGKSMGGRMATHVAAHHADAAGALAGIVLLGYPLHPPAQPAKRRDAHLPLIRTPMLFVQGSRDAFGTPAELEPLLATLPADVHLRIVDGADHGLAVPGRGRRPADDPLAPVWDDVAAWVRART